MSCGEKKPYKSEKQAKRMSRVRMQKTSRRLSTYHCEECRKWHLTKTLTRLP